MKWVSGHCTSFRYLRKILKTCGTLGLMDDMLLFNISIYLNFIKSLGFTQWLDTLFGGLIWGSLEFQMGNINCV